MKRWEGRVALVTGASSGIGAVTAEYLVKDGMIVVGFARRVERVQSISPGTVMTEMLTGTGAPDSVLETALTPSDVADAVVYVLSRRQQVHIPELTIIHCQEMDASEIGQAMLQNKDTK